MKICTDCQNRHDWRQESQPESGTDCELCWQRNVQTSEINAFAPVERIEYADLVRIMREQRNKDFGKLCESLQIFYPNGSPRAGQVNQKLTDELRQIEVKISGIVDFEATYLRRLRAKDAIQRFEEHRRDSTPEPVRA